MKGTVRNIILSVLISLPVVDVMASDNSEKDFSYKPNIHGTLRPRYELSTQTGKSRFQTRNARLVLDGYVAPSIDYFVQVDLCDQGTMKPLDFWARMRVIKSLSVQVGQFRMPFGVDPFRAPHNYYFANRSFIGRQICNYRAVGGKLMYGFNKIPLQIEAGVFNSTPITLHNTWNKKFAYSGKALFTVDNVKLSAGFMSIYPESVRTNLIDGCVSWSHDRWIVEGEYMYEHYTNNSHKPCHGYNFFVNYGMPVNWSIFKTLSFQGRLDGMTSHSSAKCDDSGNIVTDDPTRNRVTVGSMLTYKHSKNIYIDIRANYEKYLYGKNINVSEGQGDKLVLELVLRF